MTELYTALVSIRRTDDIKKPAIVNQIRSSINHANYTIIDGNSVKPWGAYFRLVGEQADRFVAEFFSGLDIEQARLGDKNAELSPKILLVAPGHRSSWQYHNNRAERWKFLTSGGYYKNTTDEPGELQLATERDEVQFLANERHRLVGSIDEWTIVAEIWQHTNSQTPSNEDDIIRLQDDYNR